MNGGIDLINSVTLSQFNKSSKYNDINWGVEKGDVSCVNFYMNSDTLSEANNHNFIDTTNKRNKNVTNVSEMKNTGLQDGVDIDVMLSESTLHQYSNTECNNYYHPPLEEW